MSHTDTRASSAAAAARRIDASTRRMGAGAIALLVALGSTDVHAAPAREPAQTSETAPAPLVIVELELAADAGRGGDALREAMRTAVLDAVTRAEPGPRPDRIAVWIELVDERGEQNFRGELVLQSRQLDASMRARIACNGCGASALLTSVSQLVTSELPRFAEAVRRAPPPQAPVVAAPTDVTPMPKPKLRWRPSPLGITGFVQLAVGTAGLAVSAGFFEANRRDPAAGDRGATIRNASGMGIGLSLATMITGLGLVAADVHQFRREQRQIVLAPVAGDRFGLVLAGRF